MNPTIVVSAYERTHSLQRLLNSIKHGLTGREKVLIVIGKKDNNGQVIRIAKQFVETYSNSEIIKPRRKMNLVEQFLFIGDFTNSENSIVLLEDDLLVSESFIKFATSALDFFKKESKVAGICLNSLPFNGYTKLPFTPIDDGSDTFFAQIPFYHGQAFTSNMWKNYRNWLECFDGSLEHPNLPNVFRNFPPDEWFPTMTQYLLESDRYFVFPRISYAVNFGEVGKHFSNKTDLFQTPLAHNRKTCKFRKFGESGAIYDVYQELEASLLKPFLGISSSHTVGVDINGGRTRGELERFDFVLTTKPTTFQEMKFGASMRPLEENVQYEIEGNFINFAASPSIFKSRLAKRIQFAKLMKYHFPMHGISYLKRFESAILRKIWAW